jgi:hypothetical protein
MPIVNKAIPNLPEGSAGLTKYIAIVWKALVILGGIATLLYLAWGALDWIFSGSNQDRLKRAKDKMFNGIFGLVFLALSYVIIKLVSTFTGLNILNPDWQILQ